METETNGRALPPDSVRPPAILLQHRRWITWRLGTAPNGKPTKVPDWSTKDLSRCLSWDQVKDLPRTTEQGVGFVFSGCVFTRDKALVGLDLDAVRDPIAGTIADWAIEVV